MINAAIAPRARRVLAVFNFDKNSDGVSDTSASLAPFNSIGFLTGVDNYMPASPDASGTIAVRRRCARRIRRRRRPTCRTGPPTSTRVSVFFKDYDAKAYKK